MDTLQCAVVLGKLDRFDWELERRKALGERYRELLQGVAGVKLLGRRSDRGCVWAQYTVFVENRFAVQAALSAQGIPTAVHYPKPLHHQPAYAELCCPSCCPNSETAAARVMSLPMSADLCDADVETVVGALRASVSAST